MSDLKFHLAIPVRDLQESREFYAEILGASEGRSDESWVDFNFFGHQLVAHLSDPNSEVSGTIENLVDGDLVPVPHFGIILDHIGWKNIIDKLTESKWPFEIAPHLKFKGQPGEQWTMFLRDPSGNALEFKFFENPGQIFASE
ncbi:MAG: VOC family protein [Acidimicrobiales bacterium]|tara:strand:+ start:701 stop:1129 length:429 start_codon:yes stop_codon:yes gene_type:complete